MEPRLITRIRIEIGLWNLDRNLKTATDIDICTKYLYTGLSIDMVHQFLSLL